MTGLLIDPETDLGALGMARQHGVPHRVPPFRIDQ